MRQLSELFHKCAYDIHYEEIGHNVNYAFEENGDELTIYFQGSSSMVDWTRNFWFFPKKKKPYKDMEEPFKVHEGFLDAWKEVEHLIIGKVIYPKWKHITIVGYSHGGALAMLCHECVWYYRPDLRENGLAGFGFEAPRVYAGWHVRKDLKERWKNFTIIRTGCDIVTHVPPTLFRFCHVGKILKLKGDISLVQDNVPFFIKYHYPQVVYDALVKANL